MQKNNLWLIFSICLLLSFSLITIWSTFPSLFLTQLSFVLVGVLIVLFFTKIDTSLLLNFSWFWYVLSLFLLIITFFVGRNIRGSVRWIDFGFFNLQTSEIVKPFLAIFYASYLSRNSLKKYSDFLRFLFLTIVPVLLVAKQPDLGSALTLFFLPIFLLIVAGHFKRLLFLGIVFLAIFVPLEAKLLKPYQRERLETFIDPYKDPKGAGYNVIQATIAIGSGGLLGKGVRLGTQSHLNFLPERHTDFIFASFSEEFGFVGIVVVLAAFFSIFRHCLYIAKRQKELSGYYLTLGILSVFLFQFFVNVGMNLGIMPVTGITLPIFSYGGSSLVSFAIMVGIIIRQLDLLPPIEI